MASEHTRKKSGAHALTQRQRQVLECILAAIAERGYPPSVREMGEAVGLRSSSSVQAHLNTLEAQGYIRRDPEKPRAIVVLRDAEGHVYHYPAEKQVLSEVMDEAVQLPVIGAVSAGGDVFAGEGSQERIAYSARFLQKEGAFMMRNHDDSMSGVGILNGDYLVVEPQQTAQNGDIVVALVGDDATCRTYWREKDGVRLQPEMADAVPVYVENPMIIGKVVGVLRDLHNRQTPPA